MAIAEQAPSLEAAANAVRRDHVGLAGALRWLRRRIKHVQGCLVLVIGLLPERFAGCTAHIDSFRIRLGHDTVLTALRGLLDAQLPALPSPLGFSTPSTVRGALSSSHQQQAGPDPPC